MLEIVCYNLSTGSHEVVHQSKEDFIEKVSEVWDALTSQDHSAEHIYLIRGKKIGDLL